MLPPDLEQRRVAILAEIEAAFRSASRRGGVSWTETGAIDSYGSEHDRAAARALDHDKHWSEVAADPDWNPEEQNWGGFAFLDAIGYRYYLPAFMTRSLQGRPGPKIFYAVMFGGNDPDEPRPRNKYEKFNTRQLRCVAAFVRFAADHQAWLNSTDPSSLVHNMPWQGLFDAGWRWFDSQVPGNRATEREYAAVSSLDLDQRKVALIVEIHAAFGRVHRGGGVSWSEADVIDSYGSPEARRKARAADTDERWSDLLIDRRWTPDRHQRFSFLDPIGAAYYLPAAMIRELQTGRDCDIVFHLERGPLTSMWSRLNDPQRRCVAAFLKLRVEWQTNEGSETFARQYRQALDKGWDRFLDTEE